MAPNDGRSRDEPRTAQCLRWMTMFLVAVSALALVSVPIAGGHAVAASQFTPDTAGVSCSPSLTQVLQGPIPAGSQLVLNLTYKWTNVEDIDFVAYWALLSYVEVDQFWLAPDGSFYSHSFAFGTWHTFQGALSPFYGVVEPRTGAGPFVYANYIHFTGALSPGSTSTSGFLGVFNAGGSESDILLDNVALQGGNTNPLYLASLGELGFLYFSVIDFPLIEFHYDSAYYFGSTPEACIAARADGAEDT